MRCRLPILSIVVLCLLALSAVAVHAQTGTPTSYVLRVYAAGGAQVGAAVTVAASQVSCNQPTATGSNLNPTRWRWNDPVNVGRDCVFDDASRLTALPDGNYEGTAAAANADGTSAETARVPFVRRRPNPPAVPTGLRLTE